jgi:hypothetical protein
MGINKQTNNPLYFSRAKDMEWPIFPIPGCFAVSGALSQIAGHPEIWNKYSARKEVYQHRQMSDIWVRYNDYTNFHGDMESFNKEHLSVWYPEAYKIPAVIDLSYGVCHHVGGSSIGGVLITKIPPGSKVEPHVDQGWHASYYEKFAVQLMGNKRQAFCFEGYSHSAMPGELYTFDNSRLHWVTNDSEEDRMTLIICIRRG